VRFNSYTTLTNAESSYERTISHIKSKTNLSQWQIVKNVLGWLVCAKRPLTWKEIQFATLVDLDTQSVEYEDRRLRNHIHEILGSLVTITGDRVSLVHNTAAQ
jgi:hypothetical protein